MSYSQPDSFFGPACGVVMERVSMNPKKAMGGCGPFGMVHGGGGTSPCVSWHRSCGSGAALCPLDTGSVYPGGVAALLYIRKAQVLELDGA